LFLVLFVLSVTGEGAVDVDKQVDTILLGLCNGQVNFERQVLGVPVPDDELPALGFLIPEVAEVDVGDAVTLVFLVVEQTLQSLIVDHHFDGNDDVSVEFQEHHVFLRREGDFLGAYIEEGQFLDRIVRIYYFSTLACPRYLHY
jgi:hypothetical protein